MFNKIIGGVAVVALIVGIVAYTKAPARIVGTQGLQGPQGERGLQGPAGLDGERGPVGPAGKSASSVLGAVTGPEVPFRMHFAKGLSEGGYMATSSTAATFTTTANEFQYTPAVVLWTPNVNTTVSLSGTSTMYYVPNIGDVANIYLLNASSTAGATITLAAVDAGVDLQFTEATGGDLVLSGLDWAKVTIIRQSLYKVSIIFDEMTEAD